MKENVTYNLKKRVSPYDYRVTVDIKNRLLSILKENIKSNRWTEVVLDRRACSF